MSQNLNDIWNLPQLWMQIPSNKIQQIGEPRLQWVKDRVKEFAKAEISAQRMRELELLASRANNDINKNIITTIVTVVGALTYGSGIKIFAAGLGQFATPAIVIGGLLASFGVHALATISLTNYFRSLHAKRNISKLYRQKEQDRENQGSQFSELFEIYWNSQIGLVHGIEETSDTHEFPINAAIGLLLSVIEYTCSISIANQISILNETHPIIKLIAATLPLVITWSASLFQSQKFEIPNDFADLWSQYNSELGKILPPEDLSDEQQIDWHEKRLYDDERLNTGLKIILNETFNQEHPTPELAELAFDIEYYQVQVDQTQEEKERDIQEHKQYFEKEIENLGKEFEAKISQAGMSFQERQTQRDRWMQEEKKKREDKLGQDFMKIMNLWEKRISQYQKLADNSKASYQQELGAWKTRNPDLSQKP
jgi:hypothetical protein